MSRSSSKRSVASSQRSKTSVRRNLSDSADIEQRTQSDISLSSASSARRNGRALSSRAMRECMSKGEGPNHIPFGALTVIAVCLLIQLQFLDFPSFRQGKACIGLYQVFYLQERLRVFFCHFVHANYYELTFQLVSMLWKGHSLEKCCGPRYFLLMIIVFVPLCSLTLLITHKLLADYYDTMFITYCYCGLGSLNFALKVIKMYQSMSDGLECIIGDYLCMKMKYFCWLELAVSHTVSSPTSLAANFAGILVGVLYICGPLKIVIDFIFNATSAAGGFSGLSTVIGKSAIQKVFDSAKSAHSVVSGTSAKKSMTSVASEHEESD